MATSHYSAEPALWLSAAVYRLIADPETAPLDRSDLRFVFTEHSELVDPIVDALIEYGAVTGLDYGKGEELRAAPNADDAVPPRHMLFD